MEAERVRPAGGSGWGRDSRWTTARSVCATVAWMGRSPTSIPTATTAILLPAPACLASRFRKQNAMSPSARGFLDECKVMLGR